MPLGPRISLSLIGILLLDCGFVLADGGPLDGLDAYVEHAMKAWQVPGTAIAVVKDDKVVLAKGYGVREKGTEKKVDDRTLFAIGSTSKAFTAATIAMLVKEGKVKWDDPVTRHLKGFQLYDPYATREITVRDLLCHRSGLPRGDDVWYGTKFDRDEVLRRLRYLEPNSSFRSKFGYQNIMFLAAGQIIPVHTGESWDQFVDQRIFGPLGMKRSNTSVRELGGIENIAQPHVWFEEKLYVVPYRNLDNIAPAGSINSCVSEMAQWLRLQLGRGKYEGKRLLDEDAIELMHTPQAVIPRTGFWREVVGTKSNFLTYGLGWIVMDYRGEKVVSHGGGIDGMITNVTLVPRLKLGVVILSNQSGHNFLPYALRFDILDRYLGGEPTDLAERIRKKYEQNLAESQAKQREKEKKSRVKDTKPSLPRNAYTGSYEHAFYGRISVTLEDDKLVLRHGPYVQDLHHWHYDTFEVVRRGKIKAKSKVTFVLGGDGKVQKLVLGEDEYKRAAQPKKDKAMKEGAQREKR